MSAPTARQRPFALPARLEELDGPTVDGRVRLPTHLDWWTGRVYDLSDPVDRRRMYEVVLREGSLEDLRRYVDVGELTEQFDRLVLPDEVRTAWALLLGARPPEVAMLNETRRRVTPLTASRSAF